MADSVIRTCDLALFFRKLTGIFMLKSMLDYCQVQLKDHFFIFMIFRNIIKNKNICLMTMLDTCMTEACIYTSQGKEFHRSLHVRPAKTQISLRIRAG